MRSNYVVCAQYTMYNRYKQHVKKLLDSLWKFDIPFYVESIQTQGTWQAHAQSKTKFIARMFDKFPDKSIVYTDADSEFHHYPALFESFQAELGVPVLKHSLYGKNRPDEILSGTLFFRNCPTCRELIKRWTRECAVSPREWDQRVLQRILPAAYGTLPPEYCYIFDYNYGDKVRNPVVVHYQASREYRGKEGYM